MKVIAILMLEYLLKKEREINLFTLRVPMLLHCFFWYNHPNKALGVGEFWDIILSLQWTFFDGEIVSSAPRSLLERNLH
jgi:hypothetical protein